MYYFASDMHLGLGTTEEVRAREKLFIRWLLRVSPNADAIFIVGDMFDFWYEYKRVIPKGFSRLLGALSSLADNGTPIHFFPGNHDLWAYDYLQTECGVEIHHKPAIFDLYGKTVFITHGDDIHARTNFWARIMNSIFRSGAARWMFSHFVHPNSAIRFGLGWSAHSRKSKSVSHTFLAENDPMVQFARQYLKTGSDGKYSAIRSGGVEFGCSKTGVSGGKSADMKSVCDEDSGCNRAEPAGIIDYFIFGHNHCAELYPLDAGTTAVFLGEWIQNPTYAVMGRDGAVSLKKVSEGQA